MTEEKSIIEEILERIGNLTTLEIRTIIGSFTLQDGKIEPAGNAKSIITRIDLLGGDITTALSEDFLTEPYDKIREYHAEREKRGQEIIDGNLKALKQLIDLFVAAKSKQEA